MHGFRNDGDVPASFLILFAPGIARERFFTELAGMRERGVELTPAGARDLATQILLQIHGTRGTIQIWNHVDGVLHRTDMDFRPGDAYGLALDLVQSAGAH